MPNAVDPAIRFWSRVEKTDECWLWRGCIHHTGYGVLGVRKTQLRVHRFSYELHCGPISVGLLVCHSCDVKHCVNPAHLFLGTEADNFHDAQSKGRTRHRPGAEAAGRAVSEKWKNDPEFRRRMSRSRSETNRRRWQDPAYRDRMTEKLRTIARNRSQS